MADGFTEGIEVQLNFVGAVSVLGGARDGEGVIALQLQGSATCNVYLLTIEDAQAIQRYMNREFPLENQ